MPPPDSPDPPLRLVLMFVSSEKQGQMVRLAEGASQTIGRGREEDITVRDAKASRRHARFHCQDGDLYLEDLESANGTLVNGNRVTGRRLLYAGDLVEIGNVRLRVEPENSQAASMMDPGITEATLHRDSFNLPTLGNLFSGEFDRDKLREMLEYLASNQKTGALILHTSWGGGRIFFEEGRITHALLDRSPGMLPIKALDRLLQAKEGSLDFSPNESPAAGASLAAPLKQVLQNQADFDSLFQQLSTAMGSLEARLIEVPGKSEATLNPTEVSVLALVRAQGRLAPVLDAFEGSDREAIRALLSLQLEKRIQFSRLAEG